MSGRRRPRAGAAMAVVRAINRELQRQASEGALESCGTVDANGQVTVVGKVDLAMVAFVTEQVLLAEFPEIRAIGVTQ